MEITGTHKELIDASRKLREKYLADPLRPAYHIVVPEGRGQPFDPNGFMFRKGRYHLFYIYQEEVAGETAHCWGHISSPDLVHWSNHPRALAPMPGDPESSIASGNGFIDKNGIPTLVYMGGGSGICIATSSDDNLDFWTKSPHNPVIPYPKEGEPGHGIYNVFDPHAWYDADEDTYFIITGAKVLPEAEYDTVYLFKSKDLINWQYLHQFYEPNKEWTTIEEDCACPDFFEIGGKHMLLCISHFAGARYYLGKYRDQRFFPEKHVRMNWPGGSCFAPESAVDDTGRRIMFAWACEACTAALIRETAWSGVMTLPRVLSLDAGGELLVQPAEELKKLRYDKVEIEGVVIDADGELLLESLSGGSAEICLEVLPGDAERFGIKLFCSADGREETAIYYDTNDGSLNIDTAKSSSDDTTHNAYPNPYASANELPQRIRPDIRLQKVPFTLPAGSPLRLHIFVDKSIIEVFIHDRHCVTQRVYPRLAESRNTFLFSTGGKTHIKKVNAWKMAPARL